MLIYFNKIRIKYLGCLRFACFSVAAYAVLSFASTPQSHGQHEFWDTIDAMIEEATQPEPEPVDEAQERWDFIMDHIIFEEPENEPDDIQFDAVDAISGERQDAPAPQSHGKPPESYPHFEPLDVISGTPQEAPAPQSTIEPIERVLTYPHCSRSVRATDILPANSPRRAHDGNLSQLHAYLSCVWWADASETVGHNGGDHRYFGLNSVTKFGYYNSKCADAYQCVAIAAPYKEPTEWKWYPSMSEKREENTKHNSDLLSGGFDNNDLPSIGWRDERCGYDAMDLIIHRRKLGMTDICSVKIKDPIDILCPKHFRNPKFWAANPSFTPPPNPCLPSSEKHYGYLGSFHEAPLPGS